MTEITNPHVRAGEQIHFLEALTVRTSDNPWGGGGMLCERGRVVTLTQKFIDLNEAWLRLAGDEEGQRARWRGKVIFRPGPWPEGVLTTVPGTRDHEEAREAARRAAWRVEDPGERRAALAEVDAVYGRNVTSRETASYRGGR